MSEEREIDTTKLEHELWERVQATEGVERARALTAIARIYWDRSKYQESLGYLEAARDLLSKADEEGLIDELMDINFGIKNNYEMLDKAKDAAEAAEEVIRLYRITEHPMLGEVLRDQSAQWHKAGDYAKAVEALLESARYPDPEQDEIQIPIDSYNLALSLKKLDRFDEALNHNYEALSRFKLLRNPYWVSQIHFELAQIYFALGLTDQIEEWSRKALDFAELVGDARWQYILNFFLGVVAKTRGNYGSALEFLERAKCQSMVYTIDWDYVVKIEKEIAQVEFALGRVQEADEIIRRISTIEETLLAS